MYDYAAANATQYDYAAINTANLTGAIIATVGGAYDAIWGREVSDTWAAISSLSDMVTAHQDHGEAEDLSFRRALNRAKRSHATRHDFGLLAEVVERAKIALGADLVLQPLDCDMDPNDIKEIGFCMTAAEDWAECLTACDKGDPAYQRFVRDFRADVDGGFRGEWRHAFNERIAEIAARSASVA